MKQTRVLSAVTILVIITSGTQLGRQVNCSSYLDDYFLPTAKIALNKLQQSLSPTTSHNSNHPLPNNVIQESNVSQTPRPASASDDQSPANATANDKPSAEATSGVAAAAGQAESKVNGGEFVGRQQLDERLPTESPPAVQQLAPQNSNSGQAEVKVESAGVFTQPQDSSSWQQQPSTTVTSTDLATDTDPTTTASSANSVAASADPQEQVVVEPGNSGQRLLVAETSDQASSTTTTTTTTSTTTNTQPETTPNSRQAQPTLEQQAQSPVIVVESKSADEAAVKETELEAVAAVEASIGFGDLFGSMGDSCYDEYANARYCEPEFENVAFERQVEVSSECGRPPSRFCTAYLNERHDQIRNCHICDSQHPKKRHPAAYLTDMNNSNSPTCWVSAPINAAASSASAVGNSSAASPANTSGELANQNARAADNVTLVLNLDKKYEIVYISMQFCSIKPDSLAIYKSMDYGRSWIPYQFYSSQCRRMYGRQSRSPAAAPTASARPELEASCTNSSASQSSSGAAASSGRLAFSTLDGKTSPGHNLDRSQPLQDWITATNIKIVLDRHQASWIHSNLIHPHAHNHHGQQPASGPAEAAAGSVPPNQQSPAGTTTAAAANSIQQQPTMSEPTESSLTSPSDTFNYAMSDLTVGGRCKCNGHASRCIHSKEGRLQCDCRHNTAGRDCEKCAPFHFDRPWARATQLDANPCQPCNCNGHSRKCRFDAELYRMSGKRSGGVCIGCRDNTAGRFCNYCQEGFTRDHSKPMSDKEACKHCDCHPIGSLGRACNQTTGQCPCKEGVSGLQCNRCAPGYQQSSSLTDPCIKLPDNENDINYYPPLTVDGDDRSAVDSDPPQGAQDETGPLAAGDGLAAARPKAKLSPQATVDQDLAGGVNFEAPLDAQANSQQDKLDDEADQQAELGVRKPHRAYWPAGQQFPRANKANTYYQYHHRGPQSHQHQPRQHQQRFDDSDDEQDQDQDELDQDQAPRRTSRPLATDDDYVGGQRTSGHGYYYAADSFGGGGGKARGYDFRHQRRLHPNSVQRHRQPEPDMLVPPVASVEHGGDELNSLDEAANYGPMFAPATIYSANAEENFNQIQAPNMRRLATGPMRGRHMATSGRQRNSANQLVGQEQAPILVPNEVVCGDCQAATRRLSSRQFCHLQFAIRANILNKYMADDWTRFEVEIQDIFRSQGGAAGSQQATRGAGNFNGAAMGPNMLLADEPSNARANGSAAQPDGKSPIEQTAPATHRIKVGTIQSIWVPTEDLTCRCPRLKLRSTYLLMGTIDAKENSANVLQLDRHGVSLEWKPSLQEKLMRYQRRLSRGKC